MEEKRLKVIKLPTSVNDWQLYDVPGANKAARALTAALKKAAKAVRPNRLGGRLMSPDGAMGVYIDALRTKFRAQGAVDSEVYYVARDYLNEIKQLSTRFDYTELTWAAAPLLYLLSAAERIVYQLLQFTKPSLPEQAFIDKAIECFDTLFSDDRFALADKVLYELDVNRLMKPSHVLAVLSATLPARNKLKNRAQWVNQAEGRLTVLLRNDPTTTNLAERLADLMKGLR